MAGAHCATSTTFITPIQRTPLKLISSLPTTPSQSKPTNRRKNYLRQKILKTLKKPYTPHPLLPLSTPTTPDIPVDSPPEQQPSEYPSDQLSAEASPEVAADEQEESESGEFRQLETSSSAGVIDGGATVDTFSRSEMFQGGLFLVGVFVFQTIVSVLVLGLGDFDEEEGSETRVLELGRDDENKANRLNGSGKLGIRNDGIVYVDEDEVEKKIAEIQAMARDVREKEGVKSKENDLDEDEDEDDDDDDDDEEDEDEDEVAVKTGIDKEVDSKLVNLKKSLNINYPKPVFSGGYSIKDGNDKVGFNAKVANDALMYKKKHKFRSGSSNPSNKPKGFQRSEDDGVMKLKSRSIERSDIVLRDESVTYNEMLVEDVRGNVSMPLEEDEIKKAPKEETKSLRTARKNLGKEKGSAKPKKETGVRETQPLNGNIVRTDNPLGNTYKRSPASGVKSRKSINLEEQNSQGVTKETRDTTTIPNRSESRERNFNGVKLGNKKPARKVEKKKSAMESDPWWLSLPYALVILLRSDEAPEGLYTLNGTSHGKGDLSYTVAFEDHGDATNFCYILQSFFHDMENFSADIIPLLIKELMEKVQSDSTKVLLVRKGQLQLYAGQPLEEVESTLHALIGQS